MINRKETSGELISGTEMRACRESGLTLLELLVVIVLLGVIAASVALSVSGRLGKAKADVAALQIDQLDTAVQIFSLDVGRPPTAAEGLQALLTRPQSASGWNGPYLKKQEAILDPWSRPFGYQVPGSDAPYAIVTLGSDGAPGGSGDAADVTN